MYLMSARNDFNPDNECFIRDSVIPPMLMTRPLSYYHLMNLMNKQEN